MGQNYSANSVYVKWSPFFDFTTVKTLEESKKLPIPKGIKTTLLQLDETGTPYLMSKNGKILYDNFEKRLIGCWNYEASTIFIQSGTKRIGKNAFFGLSFQYVELPDSIEEIDETAFYWCFNLCKITIPSHQYKRIYKLIPSYIRGYVVEADDLPF